jgi:hypothetical protein
MVNKLFNRLSLSGFVLLVVFIQPGFTQKLKPLTVSVPPLRVIRQNEATALKMALTQDEDAREDEFPWYLGINKEEIIEVGVPCLTNWDASTLKETLTCYKLTSSQPTVIAVVNDRFLVGMARRGEAVITATETVVAETVVNRGTESESRSGHVSRTYSRAFPLGNGFNDMDALRVRITSNTDRKIIAVPSLKTYKTVRDTYGKGIAKNFIVASVNIINNNPSKQFLVQNVSVSFDPNQCNNLAEIWARIYGEKITLRKSPATARDEGGKVIAVQTQDYTPESERNLCLTQYKSYFGVPTTILPTDANTMQAVGEAAKYRSFRYKLFQGLRFAADVGSGLTAFNILGREGRTGFNYLGGTLFSAADAALPKVSDEKRKNLEADVPKSNLIVKGNDSEEINIFIPATHIFKKSAWEQYKKTINKIEDDDGFRQYLLLFLVANSNGILIDENSKQVDSTQGGGAKTLLRP